MSLSEFESELKKLGFLLQLSPKANKHIYFRFSSSAVLSINYPRQLSQARLERLIAHRFVGLLESAQQQAQAKRCALDSSYYLWGQAHEFESGLTPDQKKRWLIKLYQHHIKLELKQTLEQLTAQTGLVPHECKVRAMKTRWGSCSVHKKRVWLSVWLAAYPKSCLNYVLIHELCHLKVANHSKEFWDLVQIHCPEYKKEKQKLKQTLVYPGFL